MYDHISISDLKECRIDSVLRKQAVMVKPKSGPRIRGPIVPGVPHYIGRSVLANTATSIELDVIRFEKAIERIVQNEHTGTVE